MSICDMQVRVFTPEDQNNFAKLSGDYNKLHLDEIEARRYLFGGPIVHGIHLLLWGLDRWFQSLECPVELISLKVLFQKALPVGEDIIYRLKKDDKNHVEIELCDHDQVYTTVEADWRSAYAQKNSSVNFNKGFPKNIECRALTAQEIEGASGELGLYIEQDELVHLFPNLFKYLPLIQIAELLVTTRLVGMECPGYHSVFFGLDVNFGDMLSESPVLKYKVARFDRKFSLTAIAVEGPSMRGDIKAFLRPASRQQPPFFDICKVVSRDEFKGQRALVIGGSRGLGEVVSKLLAAGTAEIMITYFKGINDAQKVANDITSRGKNCTITFFDVLNPSDASIDQIASFSPTHLYYFATPFITGMKGIFSAKRFRNFCDYYVLGFSDTLNFLQKNIPTLKRVFYPSSIFIEDLPTSLSEYSIAKATGEILCSFLEKNKNIMIYKPRLPKMATDQTVSLMSDSSNDPVPIMLEQIRNFNSYHYLAKV